MAFTKLVNFVYIVIHFVAIVLFLYGYFSLSDNQNLDNLNQYDNMIAVKPIVSHCELYKKEPMFKKLVFVLIDALRADFISVQSMPFVSELLNNNTAIRFTSTAATPTVTMPRLKALLAGIRPNFLDIIRNLNAGSFNEDNFISKAKEAGRRIIFYGDDTWMKMFSKETFIKFNLTYSFFATDYTEVDTNVTDNMRPELNQLEQWDFMILHYLGLDHIGHSFGAKSHLLPQKLHEMDYVIESIYEKVSAQNEPYLILVTGDHGMTDDGNHGGSSSPEINTGLLFIHTGLLSKMTWANNVLQSVQQVDITATISLLFGLSIPIKSHGKLITPLMKHWSVPLDQTTCYLFENSMQMKNLMKFSDATVNILSKAVEGHSEYISSVNKTSTVLKSVEKNYEEFLQNAQKEVIINQEYTSSIGLFIQVIAILMCFFSAIKILENEYKEVNSVIFNGNLNEPLQVFMLFAIGARIVLLGSTSFVEMEPFFWSFLSSTIVILSALNFFLVQRTVPSLFNFMSLPFDYAVGIIGHISAIILIRIVSSWQTVASRFSKQQCILISGLFWIYLYRCDTNFLTTYRLPFFNLIPPLSSLFKARLIYLHILLLLMENFFKRRNIDFDCNLIDGLIPKRTRRNNELTPSILRTFTVCWILLICLLSKLVNIPLIAISIGLEKIIYSITKWSLKNDFSHLIYFVSTYLTFGYTFYYSQGNSNDISTIDVASGYIGLDDYMPLFTSILIVSNTYSQLIFWLLMMFVRITEVKSNLLAFRVTKAITGTFSFLITSQFLTVGYFMIVALILRNHLFIWTVVSPKLLYETFQSFLIFMVAVMVTICTQLGR
uniref:GPI ethanolamine phosphate transferase 2 C-terminal domain-containing protein n=1 Tax=Tetranychus urticae TaxID=32264 RepID=T1K8C0_TETUR